MLRWNDIGHAFLHNIHFGSARYFLPPNESERVVREVWELLSLGTPASPSAKEKPADLSISGPFRNPAASYFPTASRQQ